MKKVLKFKIEIQRKSAKLNSFRFIFIFSSFLRHSNKFYDFIIIQLICEYWFSFKPVTKLQVIVMVCFLITTWICNVVKCSVKTLVF